MEWMCLFKNIFFIVPLFGLSISDEPIREKEFGPVVNWPKFVEFGQISAVGVDNVGKVYIFHRGNRRWDSKTFSVNNVFVDRDKGPIPNDTIVILDQNDGSLLKKTGADLFYLPHGLTIDDENNVWVTDVALHQVFKFPPIDLNGGLKKANLSLGVQLEPGRDKMHFCKPTGVAVDKETKEFYVSDGYCNSRLIKYDQYGNILLILGRGTIGSQQYMFNLPQAVTIAKDKQTLPKDSYMFNLPHDVTLAQDKQTLFVADRENFRVLSFDFQSGKFKRSYAEELKSRVFSVAYSDLQGGLLFVLTNDNGASKLVAIYSVETGKLILSFSPKTNFTNPHDVAVSPDGKYCYVVELNPYKVWKFKLDMNIISKINNDRIKGDEKQNNERVEEPIPAESKISKSNFEASSSFLAVSLVASIIAISFLAFMIHYYKTKGGHRRYETRRLIIEDDDDGIRLT